MKLQTKKGSAGFTLMEILVVIIILGVLAGLAAPVFTKTKSKAFKAEALQVLNALRQSQIRYAAEDTGGLYTGDLTKLDFDATATVNGVTPSFDYTIPTIAADKKSYTLQAKGRSTAPTGVKDKTVTLTEAGVVGGDL